MTAYERTHIGGGVTGQISQDILQSIPESLIFSDLEGIIRIWNPGSETIFGYTAEEAIGQSLDLIVPETMRQAHWNGYHQAMASGTTRHKGGSMITRSLQKSGERLYIDVSFAIVKNQAGEVTGSAAISRDATERYMQERKAREVAAESADKQPAATIKLIKNGPYLVQGSFALIDEGGAGMSTTGNTTLCSCGASSNFPYCDGSHVKINFQTKKKTAD